MTWSLLLAVAQALDTNLDEARMVLRAASVVGEAFWRGAVERLLGLSFAAFTQAAVLPQGQFARFLHMAVDYKKKIGFKGQFYIEPKPKEPTKHQYDFDVASGIAFTRCL